MADDASHGVHGGYSQTRNEKAPAIGGSCLNVRQATSRANLKAIDLGKISRADVAKLGTSRR